MMTETFFSNGGSVRTIHYFASLVLCLVPAVLGAGNFTLEVLPEAEGSTELRVRIVPTKHRLTSLYPKTSGYWHFSRPQVNLPLGFLQYPHDIRPAQQETDHLAACRLLTRISGVAEVKADYCELKNDHLRLLFAIPKLKTLSAVSAEISDSALDDIRPNHLLTEIDLSDNPIGRGAEMSFLRKLPKLRVAGFGGTSLDDSGLKYFKSCPDIRELRLHNTRVTSKGLLRTLAKLKKLERLDISTIALSDGDLTVLLNALEIKHLCVNATELDEGTIKSLVQDRSLEALWIFGAQISGDMKAEIIRGNDGCVFCD